MLVDEVTINTATREELEKAYQELSMYPVLTEKERYIYNIIDKKLSEYSN